MGPIVPDTLEGAFALGAGGFVLSFAAIAIVAALVAGFPLVKSTLFLAKPARRELPSEALEEALFGQGHLAVISAAIAAVAGPHRIVNIEAAHQGAGWQAEGRVAQHGSHAMSHPGASRH